MTSVCKILTNETKIQINGGLELHWAPYLFGFVLGHLLADRAC